MHPSRRGRVSSREHRVRPLAAQTVVLRLEPLAGSRPRRRRHVEVGERSAEIETRAADDDRSDAGSERLVDSSVRELLVLGDGRLARRAARSRRAASAGATGS